MAKPVSNTLANSLSNAADIVKETVGMETKDRGVAGIEEHMKVIACCGKQVGVVDHVEGKSIKLTRKDSPDGQHHYIPTTWVSKVDGHVHLSKNSEEAENGWVNSASECGCS